MFITTKLISKNIVRLLLVWCFVVPGESSAINATQTQEDTAPTPTSPSVKLVDEADQVFSPTRLANGQSTLPIDEHFVTLSGLQITELHPARHQPELNAIGIAIDIQPLIEIRHRYFSAKADFNSAKAIFSQAQKNLSRLQNLHQSLVFVPLLTLSGVAGRLFAPLGYSYILAILMSLLIALTLTPALCYCLIGRKDLDDQEPPLVRWILPGYRKLLQKVSKIFIPLSVTSLLICLTGFLALFHLGGKFLPELREGHYIVHTTSIPGTSLQESIRIGTQLTKQFLQITGVESVSQWSGRAERGADTYGSHYSEYEVRLKPMSGPKQEQILVQLRTILADFPGILFEANTFLIERVDETISGYTSPVVVNVYGNDLSELDNKAREIARIMRILPGSADVLLRSPPGTPLLNIRLKLDQLAFWGLQPAQVIDTIQAAYESSVVGKTVLGNRIFDVAVVLKPALKKRPETIAKLPVRSKDGTLVTLERIADIEHFAGRYNILHQGAQRKQTITCNVVNTDVESFAGELKKRVLAEVPFTENSYRNLPAKPSNRPRHGKI